MNKAASIGIEIGAAFAGNFKTVFGAANDEVGKIGGAIKKLEGRQKELNAVIKEQERLGAKGSPLKALYSQQELDRITQQIAKLRREQEKLVSAQAGMSRGKSMMASGAMGLGAAAAAAATFGAPIYQAAAFESAMLGVAKQVDGARDASGRLTNVYHDMAKQVQLLGRTVPIATNEIADMVAAGARMGVAKDELIEFTKTAAMMAEAFEMPAGELAEQMGKIAGLYKIPIPAIGALADTINFLDDNAISKGGDIIEFMSRVGGVAGAIKITDKQVAALGSTLLTLGERTETAGTATNAMFQKFAAADKGTKKFKEAMDELGLSTAEVQKGMQVDAMGTMLKVLDAVGKLPAEQRLGVLTELVGLEHADTLAKLATNTGELRKQLELANGEMAKGSMQREFAARLETTNAQWALMKNRLTEVSVNLGAVLLPPLNKALGAIGTITSAVADFAKENKWLVENLAVVGGTLLGLFAASKVAAMAIGAITFAFHALRMAVMTNPIGLTLTALTVAGMLLWNNWESIKTGMVAIFNTIRDVAVAAFDSLKSAVGAVIDWLAEKTAWIFATVDKVKAAAGSIGSTIGGWFGGGQQQQSSTGTPGAGAAGVPAAVPAGAGGPRVGTVDNTMNNNIVINAAPGTNESAVAEQVRRELARHQREQEARSRGRMVDAMGY